MVNRRVLIIAHQFPPAAGGMVQRISGFCKYLQSFGWEPVILTLRDDLYRVCDYSLLEKVKGIEVFKTFSLDVDSLKIFILKRLRGGRDIKSHDPLRWAPRNPLSQKIKLFIERYILIPDPRLGWLPFAIINAIKIMRDKKPDIILAIYPHPTTILIGFILHRFFNKPLMLDIHDTWTLYPEWLIGDNGRMLNSPILKIRQRVEEYMLKLIFSSASKIITNTDYMKDMYIKKYPSIPNSKYITINNGYDPDDFTDIVNTPISSINKGLEGMARQAHHTSKKFTIAFSGSYYRHHHPLYFLKGLKCLIDKYPEIKDDLSVIFVGNFGRDNEYELNRMGLRDVVNIIPYQPYMENLKILSKADALLTTLIPPSDFDGFRLPSKVPEYLYLRKPILAIIPDGELKRLIEDTKAGIVVNPEDTEGIGVAIYDLYKRHKNNSLYIEPDEKVIKGFDYRILSKKMADVLNNVKW